MAEEIAAMRKKLEALSKVSMIHFKILTILINQLGCESQGPEHRAAETGYLGAQEKEL